MSDKFIPVEGCYFDNHRGIYMGESIIEFAESLGMSEEPDSSVDSEFYHEATDDAINWLNENFSDDSHIWGFGECGDFFYMTIEEDGNDD